MEIYILNNDLKRTEVIDEFESMIWTDRFNDVGDFELNVESTRKTRSQFVTGTKVSINKSVRIGMVETTEDKVDADGRKILNVKGHHLENILNDRVTLDGLIGSDSLILSWADTPANIMRHLLEIQDAQGLDSDGNPVFDNLFDFSIADSGGYFPVDTIAESSDVITLTVNEPDTLYNVFRTLCQSYDLGFRYYKWTNPVEITIGAEGFAIYAGCDRTTKQTVLPPVVFSPDLDNLQNTNVFKSIEKSKNVAYVFSNYGYRVVYAKGFNYNTRGLDRRVVSVVISIDEVDIDNADNLMDQAGLQALGQAQAASMFDGELNQLESYIYGFDYNVGDLVELRGYDGVVEYKRVTEQISIQDDQGERSYPTLADNAYSQINTWFSHLGDTWEEFDTETWADMNTDPDES